MNSRRKAPGAENIPQAYPPEYHIYFCNSSKLLTFLANLGITNRVTFHSSNITISCDLVVYTCSSSTTLVTDRGIPHTIVASKNNPKYDVVAKRN